MKTHYDVLIIGAGPAGLATAAALRKAGVHDIAVLEREEQAGGVPRHCQHPTFGLLTFRRPMKGNIFAQRIVDACEDTPILTGKTVVALHEGGKITVSDTDGLHELSARRVVIATGVRETPRHPRLVSGCRPQGILTTGALQQFVYLQRQKPCRNPVIVGTELVSFSALWTLRNMGVKARAMIESGERVTAYRPCSLFAAMMRTPVLYRSKIVEIGGLERVEYVVVENAHGEHRQIVCDSVIFSGQFVGEYTLLRGSHLACYPTTGYPLIDQHGRCSDAAYYATGNLTHPADMGDQCYQEGLKLGQHLAKNLHQDNSADSHRLTIKHDEHIHMTTPSCLELNSLPDSLALNMRVTRAITGMVTIKAGDTVLYRKQHRCQPARRIMLKDIPIKVISAATTQLDVSIS